MTVTVTARGFLSGFTTSASTAVAYSFSLDPAPPSSTSPPGSPCLTASDCVASGDSCGLSCVLGSCRVSSCPSDCSVTLQGTAAGVCCSDMCTCYPGYSGSGCAIGPAVVADVTLSGTAPADGQPVRYTASSVPLTADMVLRVTLAVQAGAAQLIARTNGTAELSLFSDITAAASAGEETTLEITNTVGYVYVSVVAVGDAAAQYTITGTVGGSSNIIGLAVGLSIMFLVLIAIAVFVALRVRKSGWSSLDPRSGRTAPAKSSAAPMTSQASLSPLVTTSGSSASVLGARPAPVAKSPAAPVAKPPAAPVAAPRPTGAPVPAPKPSAVPVMPAAYTAARTAPPRPPLPTPPSKTKKALYSFMPTHEDEIELAVGDAVSVDTLRPDGWIMGKNLRTGASGLFPSNYIS